MTALPDMTRTAPGRLMPISREQYAQMESLGMFAGRRVELVYGAIIEMNPMGPRHRAAIRYLNEFFSHTLYGKYHVVPQSPVDGNEYSAPEPDFTIVPRNAPADTLIDVPLVVEVSDSTLKYDLTTKARLYAETKIPEYWVIDLEARVTHVHSSPKRGKYTKLRRVQWTTTLHSLSIPELTLKLSEVL